MRVAVSTDGNMVAEHFGRCPYYTIIDIDNGKMVLKNKVENPGHQAGFIPKFLQEKNVECIICGGMGMRAAGFFKQMNIKTVTGVSGSVEDVIKKLKEGTLKGGPSTCVPGKGKGYGIEKEECDHEN